MWLKSDEVNADSSEKETEMNACETEQQIDVAHEHDTAISPHDSISQVAEVKPPSETSSPGCNASQALSDARVERAQLQAQTDALDKALELEMEELRIKFAKKKHQLETKMAQADAKIQVLQELEMPAAHFKTPPCASTE